MVLWAKIAVVLLGLAGLGTAVAVFGFPPKPAPVATTKPSAPADQSASPVAPAKPDDGKVPDAAASKSAGQVASLDPKVSSPARPGRLRLFRPRPSQL